MKSPRSIVITGASSGIGEALATAYAGPGVSLALTGRDGERLAAVAAACRAKSASVRADVIDVVDGPAMARWLAEVDAAAPVELVIANAGIGAGSADGPESEAQVRQVFAVNLDGVFNSVLPLLPAMIGRGGGQIALMSSLASFRGFPGAPAYCASKAALRVWGEALRGDLHRHGVKLSVICPGYVVSRMTARNKFPMPFLMSADRAARIIRRGLERDRARIAFPFPTYVMAWLLATLPPGLTDPLLRRLPKKG